MRLLVACREGTVVGCVIGDRILEGGRVINLAVDPAAQRQGIGAALLLAIERALPVGDMTLMVQSGNLAARSLYRRVGYEDEVGTPELLRHRPAGGAHAETEGNVSRKSGV